MSYNDQLREHLHRGSNSDQMLLDDTLLLESGLLDSLAIVRLLTFIEREFDVLVQDADFDPENFETIATIGAMIERLKT